MSELITRGEQIQFADVIEKRGFIRAKYHTWDEPRNGLVAFASKNLLRVLFQTGVNIATSYYTIKIAEVDAGLWQITYTPDLATFYEINNTDSEDNENGGQ